MAIANRTTAECKALETQLIGALKALEVYLGNCRNPARAAGVDTILGTLNTALDATIADATPPAAGT